MGAADVVPFVPLEDVTMDECIALARALGERVGRELEIPVYLYERAATRRERENLADVRRGEFEGLRDAMGTDPARAPDFGPPRVHPTAGAVAIGATVSHCLQVYSSTTESAARRSSKLSAVSRRAHVREGRLEIAEAQVS